MNVAGNSWPFKCRGSSEDTLWIFNYFRWVRVGISSCVDGSESQNAVYKPSNLTLPVASTVVNVFSGAGLPVESDCETKIISRPTDHQWSLLTFRNNGVARWRV